MSSTTRQSIGSGEIAVCCPDPLLRGRLASTLVFGGHAVSVYADSVPQLIALCEAAEPALIVLACELEPFIPSREVAAIRARFCAAPLVVVATGTATSDAPGLLRGDVQGLLDEAEIDETLVVTVRSALAGQLCIPASLRDALAQPVFSHREKQILELVRAGLTNGEIAARLYLSESTVKSHLGSSFRKLGVSSRHEAVKRMLTGNRALRPLPAIADEVPSG